MSRRYTTQVFFKMFRNASSSIDMNVNGSVTPDYFFVTATAPLYVYRVNLSFIDGSMTPPKFGGLAELTNGLAIEIVDSEDAQVLDFLDGTTIKRNADWGFLAGADNIVEPAAGDDHMPVRWTLTRGLGAPLEMVTDHKFRITVQDDLSGITLFCAMLQGALPSEP